MGKEDKMGALAMIEIEEDPQLGLSLPKDMLFDDWLALGRRLSAGQKVVNWWIGDWWAAGHHRYGERARVAAEGLFGREFQTLRNLASVCRSFETSRRRDTLSWSHHVEVAALPPAEADRLLDEAQKDGLSKAELRKRVTAYHQSRAGNDNKRVIDIIDIHADDDAAMCLDFYTADEIIIELAEALGKYEELSRRHSAFLERSIRRMQQTYGRQTEPWGGESGSPP